jgi:putative membrane protein
MCRLCFPFGCVLLLGLWWGPLAELARQAFYAHMIVHMGVVAVAAPLLALGLAGGRFDPVRKLPAVFAPIPASMVEFIFVWAWHAPLLHHVARHHALGLAAEQGTFLCSGLLLWLSVLGGEPSQRDRRAGAGVMGLLLTAMHMTLLGALIALAPRPLYPHATGHAGLTPLEDQHLGGAIMIGMGGATYLAGGLWLMSGLLRNRILSKEPS